MHVRSIEEADVGAVVELVREVLAEFGLTFGVGSATDDELFGLPASYADAGGAFWVAVDDDGSLLGTCGIQPVAPETFELRKMYVHPRARGRGAGRLLLERALTAAREAGARRVVLDTLHEMDAAVRLYERAGFVRDDDQIRGARCSRGYRLDL